EQLRVDRVRRPDARLVVELAAAGRELTAMLGVEAYERAGDRVDVGAGGPVRLVEEPSPYDLERLVRRGRPPLVGDTADDVLQPPQRFPAVGAADLQVASRGRIVAVRFCALVIWSGVL